MDVFSKALITAITAHGDQRRKYTGDPYVVHPISVAAKVRAVLTADGVWDREHIDHVCAAAIMHDVLEDTRYPEKKMRAEFGNGITNLVLQVTDVSKPSDGNRAARKAIDRKHLSRASFSGKMIKLADLIDNTASIVMHDKDFAKVYLREKAALLEVLTDGHPALVMEAKKSLTYALAAID